MAVKWVSGPAIVVHDLLVHRGYAKESRESGREGARVVRAQIALIIWCSRRYYGNSVGPGALRAGDVPVERHRVGAGQGRRKVLVQQGCYGIRECCLHSLPKLWRLHQNGRRGTDRSEAIALKRCKEEQLIFHDRPAESAAELVEPQCRFEAFRSIAGGAKGTVRVLARIGLAVEKVLISVEDVVAYVLPDAAVEVVGAGLGQQVIDSSCAIAVLRRHVQLQLLEFRHGILDRY